MNSHDLVSFCERFTEQHGRAPRIGVDLDATTADTIGGLRTWMGDKLAVPTSERAARFPDLDQYAMWIGDRAWFTDMSDFMGHFSHAERNGFYLNVPVFAGAASTLRDLEGAGFELVAVTARSDEFNADTLQWIASNNLPLSTIVHSGFDKHALEGIDVFIDDAPPVITGLLKAGRRVVVFDQSYNRALPVHEHAGRVHGWGAPMIEAITLLLDF
ncbi:5' nucleotidase, NT5C type [Cryobacterium sp. 5B3]|uniref:5' nucleotidase, NT5C type n=1 Tax=Cryobacterium sp. 5B3 TaxID=3048586 RepID=UPI002AB54C9B|nr:hypothetical protein [Cryobacterium sp. 5B3]MDY7541780.1 hypothetical protein [Cryobacterium sp. 5B3]MEB0275240.1 hypothetical protein [Cryobacterium sp. 5B3]